MTRIYLTLMLILVLVSALPAHSPTGQTDHAVVPYVVSYLGIPVIDMVQTIQTTDSTVTISYDNRLRSFFANIMYLHNV